MATDTNTIYNNINEDYITTTTTTTIIIIIIIIITIKLNYFDVFHGE